MRRLARCRVGDEGSALIIALFFATIFSLLVAMVISFVEVGLRASRNFDAQGKSAYATDGAVNAAINQFRRGGPCEDYTAPVAPDGRPLDGGGVVVRCLDENRPASGRATRPVNALLSLGSGGISTATGFDQRVLGNIYSNSTVAAGGRLIVQGRVSATGDCTGPIVTSPVAPLRCANNPDPAVRADPTQGRDPGYIRTRTAVPARRTAPACPPGWLVTLTPGYYDDAGALSAFTTNTGSCRGRVVWLQPGSYYFDFTFRGGAGTWTIDDQNAVVVAGTPKGWDPSAATRPPISVPGSCRTAADAAPVAGVQLVAGGGTHLQITKGQVELCAEPSPTDQSVALYGLGPDQPTRTLEPNEWTSNGFTNPGNATTIGEASLAPAPSPATADAALSTALPSASLALTTLRPGVPAGSLVDSATLRVVHRDDGDLGADSVKVMAAFGGSTCTGAQALALPVRPGTFVEDRIDLKAACGLTDPAAFADVAVTYSAALKVGGVAATDALDGIAVEVAYRAPTTGKPTVVTAMSGFTAPANALEIGEQPTPLTADATLVSAGPTSASISVGGLGDPPIPPGSTIDSAVLRVAHQDQGDLGPPTVTVPITGGTCTAKPLPLRPTAIVDDRIDLKACGLDDAAKMLGLTATYDVVLAAGGTTATAHLDGMWLELVYRPPVRTRAPASVTPGPDLTSFSNPDNAKAVGEAPTPLTADATLTSTASTASLAFRGYDQQLPAVPAGSFIDSAVLRVAHQDVGPMDTPTLAVTFPGMRACSSVLTKRPATLGEDLINLRACGLTDPAMLAGLTVSYTANLTAGTTTPPDATARVDGVVLDLAYRPPAIRRPTTATATAPGFANPDNAKIIRESPTPLVADVTLDPSAAPASVTVGGYDSAVPLPVGSVIDSAVLRVAHQDDAWIGPVTLKAANFAGDTCAANPPQRLPMSPGTISEFRSTDLTTCGLTTAEQLAGLTATYTAGAPPTTATQVPTNAASTGFALPDKARAIDGMTSEAPLSTANSSASITLFGYDQAPPPAGSTISAATLRLAHQDDAGVGPVTATVSFTNGTCAPQTFAPRATLGEDTIELTPCGLTDPAQLSGLTVTYDASLAVGATAGTDRLDGAVLELTFQPPPATDRLDGIELDVVFRVPTFRPLDDCLVGTYPAYPDPAPDPAVACALVMVAPVAGDTATRFAVQGTVYAPSAALDISMAGLKAQVLTRGVVARTIRLGLRSDPAYKRPLVGVPPEPVRFTAYPDVTAMATATGTPTGFTTPDNAKRRDGLLADATLSSAGPTSASLDLSGYTPDAPLPGAVDVAVLRVAHREDVGIGSVSVTVAGFPAGSPCATVTFPLPLYTSSPPPASPGPLGEDQIDLTTSCGLTALAQLANLTVTYTATLAGPPTTAATAHLDGITLDLLSGPLLRARVAFDHTQGTVTVQGWSVLR